MASFNGVSKFKLRPSSNGVGPFTLGSKISEVVAYLKKNQSQYPNNAFYFNQVDPMSMDYVIELLNCGVSLRFNPVLQRLTSVRFSRLDEVDLLYPRSGGTGDSFSYPNRVAKLIDIYTVFGPTTFGHFEDNFSHYVLEYPGLAFVFDVPEDKSILYANGEVPQNSSNELPGELYTIPLSSLYCRAKDKESQITTMKDAQAALDREPYVQVSLGESITICFPPTSSSTLVFGSHVQEVVGALGLPQQRFTKEDNALVMSRRSSSSQASASTTLPEPDYFFNYFDLGLDILFDGKLHVAKKFVLWTNIPSQPDFVRYSKCHYLIETRGSLKASSSENPSPSKSSKSLFKKHSDSEDEEEEEEVEIGAQKVEQQQLPQQPQQPQQLHAKPPLLLSESSNNLVPEQITPQMRWNEIADILGAPSGNPYWYPTREGAGAFGGMTYFAYPNIVFEVNKKDEYVSKIFLFPS